MISFQACTSWPASYLRLNCSWKQPNCNCKPVYKSSLTCKQADKQCFTKPNRLQGITATLLLSNCAPLGNAGSHVSGLLSQVNNQCDGCAGLPQSRPRSVKSCRLHQISCCATEQSGGADISRFSPLMQRQWHPTKNAHLSSAVMKPYSHRKVWWMCTECPGGHPHEWETTVGNRSNGTGCPFCANKAVCQHNSLATKFPAVAAQLSDKNPGTAHDYMARSNQIVIWQCELGHEWDAAIDSRTRKGNPSGCPVCAVERSKQPLKRHPSLTDSGHPMMQYWDWELNDNAGLDPSKITCMSHIRANWICHCCPRKQPHRWQATVKAVYRSSGCPCCAGRKACICNSLQSLFPELAAEWDYSRNKGNPDDYTAFSHIKVWWYNEERGSFQARISDRTYIRTKPLDG